MAQAATPLTASKKNVISPYFHPIVRWIRDRHNAQAILPLLDQYKEWKQANPEKALENDLQVEASSTVELSFNLWRLESFLRFQQLKSNEEELNRIFIDI